MSPTPKQVALRLEPDELERLETLQAAMQAAVGFCIKVTMSDVVRYCIARTYQAEVEPPETEVCNGSQEQNVG